MDKQTARIEGWSIHRSGTEVRLMGYVRDHPRQIMFDPMSRQTTSPISRINPNGTVETVNTLYTLSDDGDFAGLADVALHVPPLV